MLTNEERQILHNYGVNAEEQVARRAALPPGTVDAYLATRFLVNTGSQIIEVRAGQHSGALDDWLNAQNAESWAFITPWNPRSVELSPQENMQREATLQGELGREALNWVPGEGVSEDGHWREPSVLITDVTCQWAEALGTRYEQNAIVVGRRHSPAAIVFTQVCLSK